MKLHLHLGAHKTATTHFQNVLEANRCLYPEDTSYVSMQALRDHLVWGRNNILVWKKSGNYLESLLSSPGKTLVISEENIAGETKDVFTHNSLYEKLEKRLSSLGRFTSKFDETEIWFSIRAIDSFLPSIYCEALKHFPYRRFNQVYKGQTELSWVPVIEQISRAFPHSRINILRYENYMELLPKVIYRIFKCNREWDYLVDERPLSSLNHRALMLMDNLRFVLPRRIPRKIIQNLSSKFDDWGFGEKFSPYSELERKHLYDLYQSDISIIRKIDNVVVY